MNPNQYSPSHPAEVETPSNAPACAHFHPGPSEFRDRLIPLCDGRAGLRASLQIQAQTQAADPQASPRPVIDFVASDAALDRYDEIISPTGWRLDNYRRNPVFQNAHQYGDIIFTLGKALVTEVRITPFPHLFQRIEFAVDVNPMARIAYGLYKNQFLNAVSVGFIPLRWENSDGTQHNVREFGNNPNLKLEMSSSSQPSPPEEERENLAAQGRFVAGEERTSTSKPSGARQARRTYLEQELLEVSAVGIPANPEALQLGLKAGAIERTDLRALLELLMQKGEGANAPSSPGPTIQHPGDPERSRSRAHPHSPIYTPTVTLLQLARALRDLLRRS